MLDNQHPIQEQALIIEQIKRDLDSGRTRLEVKDGHRMYTDGVNTVPLTDVKETTWNYYKVFMNGGATKVNDAFKELPRVSLFVGPPDTGKTFRAQQIATECGIPYILIMARDNLNLETLLEDFTLVDGKPVMKESKAIEYLSGDKECLIIIDEFNTLLTGVMKTLQPLLDTTSKSFVYKDKIYNKNLNCKFILTLNEKDKGISVLPDAILSRCFVKYFDKPSLEVLSAWTGVSSEVIKTYQSIYNILKLDTVFGSRQLMNLKGKTVADVESHLRGLCLLRGLDTAGQISSLEIKQKILKAVNYGQQ